MPGFLTEVRLFALVWKFLLVWVFGVFFWWVGFFYYYLFIHGILWIPVVLLWERVKSWIFCALDEVGEPGRLHCIKGENVC